MHLLSGRGYRPQTNYVYREDQEATLQLISALLGMLRSVLNFPFPVTVLRKHSLAIGLRSDSIRDSCWAAQYASPRLSDGVASEQASVAKFRVHSCLAQGNNSLQKVYHGTTSTYNKPKCANSVFLFLVSTHGLAAYGAMGIVVPTQDMHNIRFLLRDTSSAAESKRDMAKFFRRISKKRSRGMKNPIRSYPGE